MTSTTSSARPRLVRLEGPTRCQRHAGHERPPWLARSWTRFSPRVVRPAATAARRRSAGDGLGHGHELDAGRVTPDARACLRRCGRGRGARAPRRRSSEIRRVPAAGRSATVGPVATCCGAGSRDVQVVGRRRSAGEAPRPGSRALGALGALGLRSRRSAGSITGVPAVVSGRSRRSRSAQEVAVVAPGAQAGGDLVRAVEPADVALAAGVEAGGDDGDHHLVAQALVEDRAEDDVGLRVGGGADLLGRLVDLEEAQVGARR